MPALLTVVIPYANRRELLLDCLEALERQTARPKLEVIVCDRLRDGTAEIAGERFPGVRVLPCPGEEPIPALRWRGLRAAGTPYVALLEDHSLPPPDWAAHVIAAHERGLDAVGGPVENASRKTLFDWAFFLLEYAALMPPVEEGPAAGVAAGNCSFRREVLPLSDDRFSREWETALFAHLARQGAPIHLISNLKISHVNPCTFAEFWEQRWLFSRSIAALRAGRMPRARRLAMGLAALAVLPALLPLRLARVVWAKKRRRREFFLALPMILLFTLRGVAGEAAGFWFGDGGALRRVR